MNLADYMKTVVTWRKGDRYKLQVLLDALKSIDSQVSTPRAASHSSSSNSKNVLNPRAPSFQISSKKAMNVQATEQKPQTLVRGGDQTLSNVPRHRIPLKEREPIARRYTREELLEISKNQQKSEPSNGRKRLATHQFSNSIQPTLGRGNRNPLWSKTVMLTDFESEEDKENKTPLYKHPNMSSKSIATKPYRDHPQRQAFDLRISDETHSEQSFVDLPPKKPVWIEKMARQSPITVALASIRPQNSIFQQGSNPLPAPPMESIVPVHQSSITVARPSIRQPDQTLKPIPNPLPAPAMGKITPQEPVWVKTSDQPPGMTPLFPVTPEMLANIQTSLFGPQSFGALPPPFYFYPPPNYPGYPYPAPSPWSIPVPMMNPNPYAAIDEDQYGRMAQPLPYMWANNVLDRFAEKYPLTGQSPKAVARGRHAALIQQKLEELILEKKEKEALRKMRAESYIKSQQFGSMRTSFRRENKTDPGPSKLAEYVSKEDKDRARSKTDPAVFNDSEA